jgi:hypothetical protein
MDSKAAALESADVRRERPTQGGALRATKRNH